VDADRIEVLAIPNPPREMLQALTDLNRTDNQTWLTEED